MRFKYGDGKTLLKDLPFDREVRSGEGVGSTILGDTDCEAIGKNSLVGGVDSHVLNAESFGHGYHNVIAPIDDKLILDLDVFVIDDEGNEFDINSKFEQKNYKSFRFKIN